MQLTRYPKFLMMGIKKLQKVLKYYRIEMILMELKLVLNIVEFLQKTHHTIPMLTYKKQMALQQKEENSNTQYLIKHII